MADGKIKMNLKILKAEKPEGKKYHKVYADGHKSYFTCWSESIHQYIGKEQEFDVTKREMQGENGPWYAYTINLPGSEGGYQKSGKSWGGGGQDPEITAKNTIVMQLVELWKTTGLKDAQEGVKFILQHIDSLWKAYDYKTAKPAPQEVTAPVSGWSGPVLKAPLVAILKHKTKGWSIKDIIDVFGQLGIEIPHNLEAGEVYFERITEQQANDFIKTMEVT